MILENLKCLAQRGTADAKFCDQFALWRQLCTRLETAIQQGTGQFAGYGFRKGDEFSQTRWSF